MKKNWLKKSLLALTAVGLLFTACKKDDEKNDPTLGNKEGILLVTFGSSYEAPQETFKKVDEAAHAKFPGEEIRWAYTSDIIINKLRQGNGEGALNGVIIDNDSPEEAIELMVKDGYSTIAIQSMHVIPGEEYDELLEITHEFESKYPGLKLKIGEPLLTSDEDIENVAQIVATKFATEIQEGPVCFMGHGTPHESDNRYPKFEAELQKINPNFFVGTVEGNNFEAGTSSIGGVIDKLQALDPFTKVTISPLMSIAGDHANNDMNGITGETDPAEQSWRERLEAEGYQVTDVMKGLADYPEVIDIWMGHLEAIK